MALVDFGGPGRNRTTDTRIFNPLLSDFNWMDRVGQSLQIALFSRAAIGLEVVS